MHKQNKKNEKGTHFVLSQDSPLAVQEAYKVLRTNVAYSITGSGAKCIGITSSERNEGKSATALNLAISFAQLGKRVILIDGDMRMPTIASKLGIKCAPGLSDILVGKEQNYNLIKRINHSYFHVLTSGKTPHDPTTLLDSQRFGALISIFRKQYDYIFVDLPPATTVADASIVSKYMDGFILVVRHETARQNRVTEMLNKMKLVNANILGFVYNDAPIETRKNYEYYL